MRSGRKGPRKKVLSRNIIRSKKRSAAKRPDSGMSRRLEDLREQIDIVLPEVTARIAALEHLLREKQLVSRADLISARAFVRLQES